jgi:hypothetical protein
LGIHRLRREIERLTGGKYDHTRPLTTSTDEFANLVKSEVRSARSVLGLALVAEGDTATGLALIRRATTTGWDIELFRQALAVELAFGDTTFAIEHLARLAIDPFAGDSVAEPGTVGPMINANVWEVSLGRARSEFSARISDHLSQPRPMPSTVVTNDRGEDVSLNDRLRGRVSIIVTWSDSIQFLSDYERMMRSVSITRSEGIQVLGVLEEDSHAFASLNIPGTLPNLFYGPARKVSTALGRWSTRSLFVVDEQGRIRSNPRSWEEAVRHALAIDYRNKLAA